jgi:Ca2+-transporting ATPase
MEKNTMLNNPRPFTTTFFSWKELTTSIIQGIVITIGVLITYQYAVSTGYNEYVTRTMVFTSLITANIVLTFVNRSFYYSVITTFGYKNNLIPMVIGVTIVITLLLLFVDPFTAFFDFEQLGFNQILISVFFGFISVIWYEIVKWFKRRSASFVIS